MDYVMILSAVAMFGIQFLFNQRYGRLAGSGLRATMIFKAGSAAAGLCVLGAAWVLRGAQPMPLSRFALGMALLMALDGIGYQFFSLKALGQVNLSLYSVFAMLGGMLLPFLLGLVVYREEITVGKILAVLLIAAALALTIRGAPGGKTGFGYCAGVFVLNGLSGVISKIYAATPCDKPDALGFTMLSAGATLPIALAALFVRRGDSVPYSPKIASAIVGSGILSYAANLILLVALARVPASTQYPMVTGGVMAVSALLSCCTGERPTRRELGALALAIAGVCVTALR